MIRPRRLGMKKTDEMDHWLDSLGLYRKHIARDGSCLFRAVAEQVFLTQRYHKEVRKQCMDYIEGHKYHFAELVDGSLEEYVAKMRQEHQWGDKVELEAMALLYKRDMVVYYEVGNTPLKATRLGFPDKIYLCLSYGNHYDIVFSKEHVSNAALSQSLVYGVLYKGVFDLAEVDYAVDQMLHQKPAQDHRRPMTLSSLEPFKMQGGKEVSEKSTNMKMLLEQGVTPFPYKVAKALDTTIYRNIDFDIWSDMRKEMRLASQTAGELQVGMKCLVTLEHSESLRNLVSGGPATCHAHIQKVLPNKGPVEVYVEELGERRMVSHAQLEPLRVRPSPQKPPLFIRQYAYRQLSSMSDKGMKKMPRNRKPKTAEQFRACDEQCTGNDQQLHENVDFLPMTESPNQMPMFTMPMAPPQHLYVSMTAPLPGPSQATPPPQQLFVSMPRQLLNPPSPPLAMPVSPPRNCYENACSPPHLMQTPKSCYETPQAAMLLESNSQLSANGNTSPVSSAGYGTSSPSPPIVEPSEVQINDVNGNSINFWAPKSENLNGNDLPFQDMATIRFFYNLGHDCFHVGAPIHNGENTPPVTTETTNEGSSPPGVGWQMVDHPNMYRGNCAQCSGFCTYPTPAHAVMYYPLDVGARPLPYCPQMPDSAEGGVDLNECALEPAQPPGENGVLFTPPPPLYLYHPRGGVNFSHPPDYPPNQGNFSPPVNGMGFPLTPTPVSYPPTPHGVPFSPTPNQMFTFTPPPPAWFRNQHM